MVEPNNGWQDSGVCRTTDNAIDLFFSETVKDKKAAVKICASCPVIAECLNYALIYDVKGTWGGMTERERSRIPRRNRNGLREDYIDSGLYNPNLKV